MRGQASDLGTNWFLTRNLGFSRDYLDKVQQVTLDDVKRVADKYLRDRKSDNCFSQSEGFACAKKEGATTAEQAGEIQKFEM